MALSGAWDLRVDEAGLGVSGGQGRFRVGDVDAFSMAARAEFGRGGVELRLIDVPQRHLPALGEDAARVARPMPDAPPVIRAPIASKRRLSGIMCSFLFSTRLPRRLPAQSTIDTGKCGINFIDTADVYSLGESETLVGNALKGVRTEIVLATKVRLPMSDNLNRSGATRVNIMREVEASLQRLQTDYIDLYQVHGWDTARSRCAPARCAGAGADRPVASR